MCLHCLLLSQGPGWANWDMTSYIAPAVDSAPTQSLCGSDVHALTSLPMKWALCLHTMSREPEDQVWGPALLSLSDNQSPGKFDILPLSYTKLYNWPQRKQLGRLSAFWLLRCASISSEWTQCFTHLLLEAACEGVLRPETSEYRLKKGILCKQERSLPSHYVRLWGYLGRICKTPSLDYMVRARSLNHTTP